MLRNDRSISTLLTLQIRIWLPIGYSLLIQFFFTLFYINPVLHIIIKAFVFLSSSSAKRGVKSCRQIQASIIQSLFCFYFIYICTKESNFNLFFLFQLLDFLRYGGIKIGNLGVSSKAKKIEEWKRRIRKLFGWGQKRRKRERERLGIGYD